MPSSTSSSEKPLLPARAEARDKRAFVVPLAMIAAFLILLEIFTWTVIEKRSKLQAETNRERAEAFALRSGSVPGRKDLLLAGNSLVGFDIDARQLQNKLGAAWRVHRFWIHNTTYEDWQYGLKSLLAGGSRPDAICLVLAAMHWQSHGIRGDYSSPYLFRAADIPAIGSDLGYDRTQTSNLLFARFSRYYALRTEIHKQALQFVLPDLPRMYALIQPTLAKRATSAQQLAVFRPRMRAMAQLAHRYGTNLILVVPPIPRQGEEWRSELQQAAREAGLTLKTPWGYSDVPASQFVDDTHLSPSGATLFTSRLADDLRPDLENAPVLAAR